MPTQPSACSVRCQPRSASASSGVAATSTAGGGCCTSHDRSSARSSSSAVAIARRGRELSSQVVIGPFPPALRPATVEHRIGERISRQVSQLDENGLYSWLSDRRVYDESDVSRNIGPAVESRPPNMAVDPVEDADEPAWRERAVSRSLNAARSRAEQRVQRFLDAAFELIDEKGTTEFTIQEVDRPVEAVAARLLPVLRRQGRAACSRCSRRRSARRSTTSAPWSTRSPIRSTGCAAFAIRLHEWCDPSRRRASAGTHNRRPISEFSMQLAVNHPDRVRGRAGAADSRLLLELVDAAADAGAIHVADARRADRARPADRDVQLVRQPPGREPEAAAHRRGDLGVLPPRPRRLSAARAGQRLIRTVTRLGPVSKNRERSRRRSRRTTGPCRAGTASRTR